MKFNITYNTDRLILEQKRLSIIVNIGRELLGLIISSVVLLIPYSYLTRIHEILWLIYFVPILSLIGLIKGNCFNIRWSEI